MVEATVAWFKEMYHHSPTLSRISLTRFVGRPSDLKQEDERTDGLGCSEQVNNIAN